MEKFLIEWLCSTQCGLGPILDAGVVILFTENLVTSTYLIRYKNKDYYDVKTDSRYYVYTTNLNNADCKLFVNLLWLLEWLTQQSAFSVSKPMQH